MRRSNSHLPSREANTWYTNAIAERLGHSPPIFLSVEEMAKIFDCPKDRVYRYYRHEVPGFRHHGRLAFHLFDVLAYIDAHRLKLTTL